VVARGEVHWLEVEDDKRRPVLVLSPDPLVAALRKVLVVPLTTTVRNVPTEVSLGPGDGVPRESAANCNDVRAVPRTLLVERVATLGQDRMLEVCAALRRATGC
jgi:mRNA interferase MazF